MYRYKCSPSLHVVEGPLPFEEDALTQVTQILGHAPLVLLDDLLQFARPLDVGDLGVLDVQAQQDVEQLLLQGQTRVHAVGQFPQPLLELQQPVELHELLADACLHRLVLTFLSSLSSSAAKISRLLAGLLWFSSSMSSS